MENKVRINIRTATSSRSRQPSILVQDEIDIPLILMSFSFENDISNILTRSFESDNMELERNDEVEPDISHEDIKEKDEEKSCVICISEFEKNQRCTELSCGHYFHTECITEWCKYKTRCPVCRSTIPVK